MNRRRIIAVVIASSLVLIGITQLALAQRWGRFRSIEEDRRDVPTWEVDKRFPGDVFTFARVYYDSYGGRWAGAEAAGGRIIPIAI